MIQPCLHKRAIWFTILLLVIIICFCLFFVFCAAEPASEQQHGSKSEVELSSKELLYVVTLFRHGARTPVATYPNDPHKNQTFYPHGLGQLTNEGKQDLYDLGIFLRKRYGNFLKTQYDPQAVFSQSTDVTRTKMSLQIVVAGLYPPKDTAMEWNHELNWQPIEIAAEPLQDVSSSKHIPILKPCPRVDEAVKEVNESPEVKAILEENKEMTQKLTNLTGSPIKTTCDVHLIYDTLLTESEFGLKLPQWSQEFYPHKLRNLAELCYIHIVYTNELKQLKAGPFIQKMLTEFQQKRNGTLIDLQISLYSAHDVTVVNILSALNMWKQQLPGPAIMTVFELVRDKETQEIGVEIYLRTNATSGAIPLTVPNCGHFCPLDKFILIASKVIPKDHDALCQSKNSHLID